MTNNTATPTKHVVSRTGADYQSGISDLGDSSKNTIDSSSGAIKFIAPPGQFFAQYNCEPKSERD